MGNLEAGIVTALRNLKKDSLPGVSRETLQKMYGITVKIVTPGFGILAADESDGTIKKRFDKYGIPNTPENRAAYRAMLFSTPRIERNISGVIFFDETLRQEISGVFLRDICARRGITVGIKVDKGTEGFRRSEIEKVTKGLGYNSAAIPPQLSLADRLDEYRGLGAEFAKWRAIFTITGSGKITPSDECIEENAGRMAIYARLCQERGIVPIVEPEVLMDGDHDYRVCADVTRRVLEKMFRALDAEGVDPAAMLLKPNMVLDGEECAVKSSVDDKARATVETLASSLPANLGGVVFLSGGQTTEESIIMLSAINRAKAESQGIHLPNLSFSYGRALQAAALSAWMKDGVRHDGEAQNAFAEAAEACSKATLAA